MSRFVLLLLAFGGMPLMAQAQLDVFIFADMDGVAGAVTPCKLP